MEVHYTRHALKRLAKECPECMKEGAPTFLSAYSRIAQMLPSQRAGRNVGAPGASCTP